MNFAVKDSPPQNTTICGLLVKMYVCPSDPNTQSFNDGGTVFGAAELRLQRSATGTSSAGPNARSKIGSGAGTPSRGAFAVNQARSIAEFTDGTSNTVLFAEIKIVPAVA